jgi:hypothetical protein
MSPEKKTEILSIPFIKFNLNVGRIENVIHVLYTLIIQLPLGLRYILAISKFGNTLKGKFKY